MKNRNKTLKKLNNKMVIDIRGLPEQESKILLEFIRFLKKRGARKKTLKRKVNFRVWDLNSKSKLTRKEIYDYL
jgi:hypothetical protein